MEQNDTPRTFARKLDAAEDALRALLDHEGLAIYEVHRLSELVEAGRDLLNTFSVAKQFDFYVNGYK